MRLYFFGVIGAIFLILVSVSISNGQTSNTQNNGEVILSWQALNFFPADYKGKSLASPFSPIRVGVEMIEKNKFVDLSNASITWKLDNEPLARGTGMKEVLFRVKKDKGDFHVVRVYIENNGTFAEGSVFIPITPQTIVVELPYPGNTILHDVEYSIQAIPYFFNIRSLDDLAFYWQVNNTKKGGGSNNILALKTGKPQIPDQKIIELTASVQNTQNPLEFAKTKLWLNVK